MYKGKTLYNKKGLFLGSGLLKRLTIPFRSDLDTWHKGITDNDFAEKINNLPAKILPRVGSSNGTSEKITWVTPLSNNLTEWSIGFRFNEYQNLVATLNFVVGGESNKNILFFIVGDEAVGFRAEDSLYSFWDGTGNTTLVSTTSIKDSYHSMIFRSDGTNIYLYLDGINKGYVTPINTKLYFDSFCLGFDTNTFGTDGNFWDLRFWNSDIGQTEALKYHLDVMTINPTNWFPDVYSGYDISGSNHADLTSNLNYDYELNGSLYANDNGYSLWQKAANPDIQVPFDINGDALSLTVGIDIPTGYTKTRDIVVGGSKWNMADCLVDTEYGSLLQCDTAGVAYKTNTVVYGLVFDGIINKGADGNSVNIQFISSIVDTGSPTEGYLFQIPATERINFFKTTGGSAPLLFQTTASYILNNTDYRLLIWRNETTDQYVTGGAGTFAVYIQGKNKAITNKTYTIPNADEMELIPVSSGSNPVTDNTYTTSFYTIADNDAGDQVSKININGEYISPYDFTVSTGAYSIIDNADNAIFNRTNATRQTATSRASLFYDSSYPFRYQINEIADPRIYDTFFETDYKNRAFGKVRLSGSDLIRYDEQLNYATKKTGADLTKVLNYCKISDIYYIPEILFDGNTVAWYDSKDLTTLTLDGSNLVAQWNDKLASGHDLIQATGADQLLWSVDGILGDGVSEFMQATFTFNQPEFIYMVVKQVTWTDGDRLFDGKNDISGILSQLNGTPNISAYAGSSSGNNGNFAVNTWGIIRILFNGASSKFQVNETTAIIGDFGAANMGGFTLAARASVIPGGFGNIQFAEIILRKVADTAPNEAAIYAYLKTKYNL